MSTGEFVLVWPAKLSLDQLDELARQSGVELLRARRNDQCTHVQCVASDATTAKQLENFVARVGLFVFSYLNPEA